MIPYRIPNAAAEYTPDERNFAHTDMIRVIFAACRIVHRAYRVNGILAFWRETKIFTSVFLNALTRMSVSKTFGCLVVVPADEGILWCRVAIHFRWKRRE